MLDPNKNVIVSDLDGVLFDGDFAFQKAIWKEYKVWADLNDMPGRHDYTSVRSQIQASVGVEVSEDDFETFISTKCWGCPSFYREGNPFTTYWQALYNWTGALFFLTARPVTAYSDTTSWLGEHGFNNKRYGSGLKRTKYVEDYIFNNRKGEAVKNINLLHPDKRIVFFEDAPHHALSVANSGIDVIVCYIESTPVWSRWENNQDLQEHDKVLQMSHDKAVALLRGDYQI